MVERGKRSNFWHETRIPGWIRDFRTKFRAVSHIQGCDQILQGQSHKSFALAWELARLESKTESVGYHQGPHTPEGLYDNNKAH